MTRSRIVHRPPVVDGRCSQRPQVSDLRGSQPSARGHATGRRPTVPPWPTEERRMCPCWTGEGYDRMLKMQVTDVQRPLCCPERSGGLRWVVHRGGGGATLGGEGGQLRRVISGGVRSCSNRGSTSAVRVDLPLGHEFPALPLDQAPRTAPCQFQPEQGCPQAPRRNWQRHAESTLATFCRRLTARTWPRTGCFGAWAGRHEYRRALPVWAVCAPADG